MCCNWINVWEKRADPITTQLDLDSCERNSEKSLRNTLKLIEPQHYIYIYTYILHAVYIYISYQLVMIILLHMYRIIGDGPGWFTAQFAT